jgi:hypothetical protein
MENGNPTGLQNKGNVLTDDANDEFFELYYHKKKLPLGSRLFLKGDLTG